MSKPIDYVNDLADPLILARAIRASGRKEDQRDYMVAVDRRTGQAIATWRIL